MDGILNMKIVRWMSSVKRIRVAFPMPANGVGFLPSPLPPTVGAGSTFREKNGVPSYPTMFNPPFTLRICPVM
jgi:hypothetical protein